MLYLEMLASQERIRETRRQVEHNRLEARLAQGRSSADTALRGTLPYPSVFTGFLWSIRRWQGAGW